jgi:hypothetical protein
MEKMVPLGKKNFFRSDFGPVSFGWVPNLSVVSWSGEDSHDLLLERAGEGIYLYPTKLLKDSELTGEPMRVWPPTLAYVEIPVPLDWNKDGFDDLIIATHEGFLYWAERRGNFPNLSFELVGPLKDDEKDRVFNIPYDNPNHPVMDNLGGYFDTAFFSNPSPIIYPSIDKSALNLIIGDWAGNLWWMPDLTKGKGKPRYRGIQYTKPEAEIVSKRGKEFIQKYGSEYVKPQEKIGDENGKPFLLGESVDVGFRYQGGSTRPVLYKNEITHSSDLLVLADAMKQLLYYLQRINPGEEGTPVFKNLGEVHLNGCPLSLNIWSRLAVYNLDGANNLLVSLGFPPCLAVFKNANGDTLPPQFEFSHLISGKDVISSGYNFVELLRDKKNGKRYFLDGKWTNEWTLREVRIRNKEVRLGSEYTLLDQNGPFRVEGETDPQFGEDGGFHRAAKWDFDGSGRQHLIVGTDKGLLYLLREGEDLGTNGEFRFNSIGPLKDENGNVIKVHNRVCAAGIDLNGDGREDLILGGVTYQLGTRTDPHPGGGFYYCINKGIDENGWPRLGSVYPLKTIGFQFKVEINNGVWLQALDIDHDGEKEAIMSVNVDGKGRIFKVAKEGLALEYTGEYLEELPGDRNLLDIDEDGVWELVFAGGEAGVGWYRKVIPDKIRTIK